MSLVFGPADHGSSVQAHVGDIIAVQLDENPTTGFRWTVYYFDKEILSLIRTEFKVAADAAIGATGQRIYSFRANKPGKGRIEMKLWQEWEGDALVLDGYDVTIRVQGHE